MAHMNLKDIQIDDRITPRPCDKSMEIQQLLDAHDFGVTFPPLLVDKASKRLVDGRRRLRVYKKRKVERVPVEFREFPGGLVEMLKAAAVANQHGERMGRGDYLQYVRKMEELGGTLRDAAEGLQVPVAVLEELRSTRTAYDEKGEEVDLKPALRDLAGQTLTPARVAVNRVMNANPVDYMINRVTDLLREGLVPRDEKHDEAIRRLEAALEKRRAEATAAA